MTKNNNDDFSMMPGFLLRRCHQISVGIFHEHCKAYDLTPLQFGALSSLSYYGALDQVTLGGTIALDRTTVALIVTKLQTRKLVSRSASKKDKRSKIVEITPKGQELIDSAENAVKDVQREILSPLSEKESKILLDLLHKMAHKNNAYSRAPQKLGTCLRK